MSDTPVPPSKSTQGRNAVLVGVGLLLASQVPTTLGQISDPTTRGLLQMLAVVIVLWVGVRVR